LESQLTKAELAYRGLWDKSKQLEETVDKQHALLVQLSTPTNQGVANEPNPNASKRTNGGRSSFLDQLKKLGGAK